MATTQAQATAPKRPATPSGTANPATNAATKVKEVKPAKVIATVKAGALSLEVGPAVISGLDRSYKDEAKAKGMLEVIDKKKYDLLATMTAAIVKAVKADDTINLSATFNNDVKQMNLLNDQLGLALGFREVTRIQTETGKEIAKIGYAKSVLKFFPGPKDKKGDPEAQRKATLRSNFLHMLKKCAQAASGIIEKDITFKHDAKSGTLEISGPAVAAKFGSDKVLLDERQSIGSGDNVVKLKEKPSFTALAKMGAEAEGKTLQTRPQSGVASQAVTPDLALQSIANTFLQTISKLRAHPDAKTIEAMLAVKSAIDKVLQAAKS
jgi:hypothetical protein